MNLQQKPYNHHIKMKQKQPAPTILMFISMQYFTFNMCKSLHVRRCRMLNNTDLEIGVSFSGQNRKKKSKTENELRNPISVLPITFKRWNQASLKYIWFRDFVRQIHEISTKLIQSVRNSNTVLTN